MEKKALMIVNPTAGKQTVKGQVFSIIEKLCGAGYAPTVLTTSAKGDATAFAEAKTSEHDLVVCCGGDGTLNETITGMLNADCFKPICYIPCGTTNDMATSLGLPKTIKKATEVLDCGTSVCHDIGKFGDMAYFTYIASFGAFTKVSYATPQTAKNLLGHFAYVLSGAMELGNIKSYHTKLTFDGQTVEDDFIYVSVTNTRSFAGLFSFGKDDVTLNDGLFEILLIKTPKNVIDISNILHSISTKSFNDKNIMLFHTKEVRVQTDEDIVWTIDGESSPEVKEVEIRVIPDKVEILRP